MSQAATQKDEVIAYSNYLSLEIYEFLKDSYWGSGGYLNGAYLSPNETFTRSRWELILHNVYFPNYVRPVVSSHVNPLFQANPNEEFKEDPRFEAFRENCDLYGLPFQGFVKRSARMAKLYGSNFTIVDNFPGEQISQSLQDNLQDRILPFLINIPAAAVVNEKTILKTGGWAQFAYKIDHPTEAGKQAIKIWTPEVWSIEEENGRIIDQGENAIGEVPVAGHFPYILENHNDITPISEFLQIAKANLRLYNMVAGRVNLEDRQSNSTLIYPGKIQSLVLSIKNALSFDANGSHKPEFISPNPENLKNIIASMQDIVGEIYRQAQLSHLQLGDLTQQSGASKEWDFEITSQALRDFAKNTEFYQEKVVRLFGRYINTNLNYSVDYPDRFTMTSVETELERAISAIDLDFGPQGNGEVKKQAAKSMFNNSPDALEIVEESIDQQTEQNQESEKDISQGGVIMPTETEIEELPEEEPEQDENEIEEESI